MENTTVTGHSTEFLKVSDVVLDCDHKDETGLNDFQKVPDPMGIAIPKVGIERYRVPLTFRHKDGSVLSHDCSASMFVNLSAGKTGINMSRLVTILQEESKEHFINSHFLKTLLTRYRVDLRDSENDKNLDNSYIEINFSYPMKQKSLKSENWGWQYYDCTLKAQQNSLGEDKMFMSVNYEYSSTCPCSLSMAKQYEQDYAKGITTEGSGIAAAHAQRSNALCTVQYDQMSEFCIEDLVELLRVAIPTETQSVVKRIDEQAFAILNGENPMFVEHASKALYKVLNKDKRILDWNVKLEHFESLHSHNAVAYISK